MKTRLAIACLSAGLLACASSSPGAPQSVTGSRQAAPGVQRLSFEVEVDCTLARDQVWLLQEASDEQVVAVGANAVRRRCEAMERAVEVELEPGTRRFRVSLPSIDPRDRELLQGMLRSIGLCELFFVADEVSARARGIDLAAERAKLATWRKANSGRPLEFFSALEPAAGGPARGLGWITAASGLGGGDLGWPVLLPECAADHIGALSFARVYEAEDATGNPALGFELRPTRSEDLARVTEAHVGQRLAIVLFGQLVSAPVLQSKLTNGGVLEGRFEKQQVARFARAIEELRSPLTVVNVR